MNHSKMGAIENLLNKLALGAYDLIAYAKGYTFKEAVTQQDFEDADTIYGEDGFSFPVHLEENIQKFKAGTLNFIAYYKGIPVGLVRIANPKIINRAYEHYGVDKEGMHHEIQSLVVRKQFRDGAQFVMLGLVKKIYEHSVAKSIDTWSACGKRNVYLTMRRYCKDIELVDVDFKSIDHPVTQYLYANNIIEVYFTMPIAAFSPFGIFKKYVKKVSKKWSLVDFINDRLSGRQNMELNTTN